MIRYLLFRLAWIPIGALIVVSVLFFVIRLAPGGAVSVALGPYATKDLVDEHIRKYGLDQPLVTQYLIYVRSLLKGDLGTSLVTGRPVSVQLGVFLPASAELVGVALLFIVLIGIPLGVGAAVWRDRWPDLIVRGISIGGVSLSSFWLGLMLLLVFYFWLGWFPSGGRISLAVGPPSRVTGLYIIDSLLEGNWKALLSTIYHILLPAFTLAITNISTTARLTRDGLLKAFKEDYILVAWAYGVRPRRIYFKYALKNGILPTMTNLGMLTASLFAGAFVVETVFSFPGLGYYATSALLYQDYPPITGAAIVIALLFLVMNLLVDVCYGLIDPRIRG